MQVLDGQLILSASDLVGHLACAHLQGRADFPARVERPSGLGGWGYEPADAKLSRIVKGAAVLQLCLYSDQVRRLQGTAPERIAVITGDGRLHHYRLDDYDAYSASSC